MKALILIPIICLTGMIGIQGQVSGLWKSTDHTDDIERSIVRIYEINGKLFGQVEKLLPAATITHCTGCEGELKNKSLIGMIIISDVIKNGDGGTGGRILDPRNGKSYSCDLKLASPDKLEVTGYMGLPFFGKKMYWNRVN